MFTTFSYLVHDCTAVEHDVRLPRVLQTWKLRMSGTGGPTCQDIPDCDMDAPPNHVTTRYKKQLLLNAILYEHVRIEENLHLEWCRLRQRPDKRKRDNVTFKSVLNIASPIDINIHDLLVDQCTSKHLIDALAFQAVQRHCG